MQFAKDSFYMTLRDRLAALNPKRTITLNGAVRPAVVVAENEMVIPVEPLPDAFYVEWGAARRGEQDHDGHAAIGMDCVISYHTLGTTQSGVDRGRTLTELDVELMNICMPARTSKRDYRQTPSVDLGTNVFWTLPQLEEVAGREAPRTPGLPLGTQGVRLERRTKLTVFFFSEVTL